MKRTDLNAPIEAGVGVLTRLGQFLESPLAVRDVTRCFRWDAERALHLDAFGQPLTDGRPQLYFPFNNFTESTDGARVWSVSGAASIGGGLCRIGTSAFAAAQGIISLPHESMFNFTDRACTIRFVMSYDSPGAPLGRVTRCLFKGDATDFGFHFVNGELPNSGWGLELFRSGSSTVQLALCIAGSPGVTILLGITNPNPFQAESFRIALVHDFDAGEMRVYCLPSLSTVVSKAIQPTIGTVFIPNTGGLSASSQSQDWSGTPGPDAPNAGNFITLDEFGIWSYAWDDEQFECDVANAYTWP